MGDKYLDAVASVLLDARDARDVRGALDVRDVLDAGLTSAGRVLSRGDCPFITLSCNPRDDGPFIPPMPSQCAQFCHPS